MAQEREISISTISTVLESDNSATLEVFFDQNLPTNTSPLTEFQSEPDILRVELPVVAKRQDGVLALEGELIASIKESADLTIDINGNLLILHENASKYRINDMGELEYTF